MKLPAIEFKGLGGKIGALLRRRKGGGEDDFDDGDEAEANFDNDDEEGGGRKWRPSKCLTIIAAAGIAGVAVLGAAGWWFFGSSDDESGAASETAAIDAGSGAVIRMPPRGRASGMMSPTSPDPAPMDDGGRSGPNIGLVVPPVTNASFAAITELPPGQPLPPAPDPALAERSGGRTLPRIAEDGRTPLQAYVRPFDARDDRPRIAVVVAGLGLSRAATEAAIRRLPPPVTLAFDAYAADVDTWAAAAREAGHELLVGMPMESSAFPVRDPGPYALLTTQTSSDNIRRLEQVLARLAGYVGVIGVHGSAFSARGESVRPVLTALKARGLMYVDATEGGGSVAPEIATEIGLPRAVVNLAIDVEPSKTGIDARLAELESLVRERAVVVAVARPYPVTMERLRAWAATLEAKNLVLAPVSAIADRQFLP